MWPTGPTKIATPSGNDPGGHNRNSANWDAKSGHYGHSQVPENTHWDPAYTLDEIAFLMEAEFDANGRLLFEEHISSFRQIETQQIDLSKTSSTMHDHGTIDEYDRY